MTLKSGLKRLARQKRYQQSPKGKATKKRYKQSEKGKAASKRWNNSYGGLKAEAWRQEKRLHG
jgi:hypothetical protein